MDPAMCFQFLRQGTPRGAVISPLPGNIYLHYAIDQWTDQWRQKRRGDVTIVRYADDAIIGFQNEYEVRLYLNLEKALEPRQGLQSFAFQED